MRGLMEAKCVASTSSRASTAAQPFRPAYLDPYTSALSGETLPALCPEDVFKSHDLDLQRSLEYSPSEKTVHLMVRHAPEQVPDIVRAIRETVKERNPQSMALHHEVSGGALLEDDIRRVRVASAIEIVLAKEAHTDQLHAKRFALNIRATSLVSS